MKISLDTITQVLTAKNIEHYVKGEKVTVETLAAIDAQVENSLCYYVGNDTSILTGIRESIIICKPSLTVKFEMDNAFIFTENPQLAFYQVSSLFVEKTAPTVHPKAIIDKNAQIGKGVSIGAFCVIDECKIGDNVIIESGVRIQKETIIGNNVHIQSNTVIGAMGVIWAYDNNNTNKVFCAQTGHVIIEDNVFIGSNITIVKGAFLNKPTIIGNGTMISHGTMIGHGVVIGTRTHFANNVAIAGSVSIGENCFLGSGSVVRPHIKIPKDTIIGAGAVVVKNFAKTGQILIGNPAQPMDKKKDNISGVPASF